MSVVRLDGRDDPKHADAKLDELWRQIKRRLADGQTIVVGVHDAQAEVSPTEAAGVLGCSRQHVDRLIARGTLTARRIPGSGYRRIPLEDVIALRDRWDTSRHRTDEWSQDIDQAGAPTELVDDRRDD